MSSLEAMVEACIDAYGFRISPRLEFGDRLTRFIEQYTALQGRHISHVDAEVTAALLMLKHSVGSTYAARTRSEHRLEDTLQSNDDSNKSSHSMRLRSHTMH